VGFEQFEKQWIIRISLSKKKNEHIYKWKIQIVSQEGKEKGKGQKTLEKKKESDRVESI
jgi:hypothetical protein